ncbi:hypothetical protein QL211_20915 [Cronobacter turicensis]|nr:hypothetical protein [Cronobacter turicensis]MDI6434287.1 hypothetical protein [Cronobacter turicensis]
MNGEDQMRQRTKLLLYVKNSELARLGWILLLKAGLKKANDILRGYTQ